jgi:hypothetical protein
MREKSIRKLVSSWYAFIELDNNGNTSNNIFTDSKILFLNILVYHLNSLVESVQSKIIYISQNDKNLFKYLLSPSSYSSYSLPKNSHLLDESFLISFDVNLKTIFKNSGNSGSYFISILSCSDFLSIFISLLQCLINLSLYPSQKESLRNSNISLVLFNLIDNIRFILLFLDGFWLSIIFVIIFPFLKLEGKIKHI